MSSKNPPFQLGQEKVQDDRTPLHRAASNGQVLLVKKLLKDCGPSLDIDCKDEMNWTPLIIACSAGHLEIVKLLLGAGASVNSRTTNNQTALHYAASKNHLDICKLLNAAGADLNARDKLRQTPLHRAVLRAGEKLVEFLTSLPKIQLNAQDSVGNTPLHLACEEEREAIIKLLIDQGADIAIINQDKLTAVDSIVNNSLKRIITNYIKEKKP